MAPEGFNPGNRDMDLGVPSNRPAPGIERMGGGGGRGGKSQSAGGMASFLYYGGITLIIFFLLLYPIYGLLWGDGSGINGVLTTIQQVMNGEATLDNVSAVYRIFSSIMAIFVIVLVVFTPFEKFQSPLNFAGMHAIKGVSDLTNTEQYKDNPDQMKSIAFRVLVYGLVTVGIFGMYFYLITTVTATIRNSGGIVSILVLMVNILVIAFLNSQLVKYLDGKDPVPVFSKGNISVENVDLEAGNRLLWGILLMVANVVILSIGTIVSTSFNDKLSSSNAGQVLEGQATSVDQLNIFNSN